MLFGPWQDRLEATLGITGQRRSGQGDRTRGEQAALNRRGVTPARGGGSAHNIPDTGLDISMRHGFSAAEVNQRMTEAGIPGHATFERGPRYGEGTAPHIHVDRRGRRTQRRNRNSGGTQVAQTPARRETPISEVSADTLLGSILGEDGREVPMNQGRHPLVNPFEVEGDMRARADRVEERLGRQEEFFQEFDQRMEEHAANRRARVEETVTTRRKINDTVTTETQSMIENVQPLLQQRTQIAEQLERLANMNPLERGLRGVVDLNYNQRYLQDRLRELDTVLQTHGQNYEFLTGLRERLLTTVTRGDENEAQVENLTLLELDEEGRSVSLGLQAANQNFAFLGDVVSQNENVVRAQIATVDRFLSERTTSDLASLESQAESAEGGRIVVDGVELTVGEIRQRRLASESQDMAFESQRLALQAGQQEIADRAATQWARNATQTQIEAAINNGGVAPNGMRIPQDVLTAQLQDRMTRTQLIASEANQGDPTRVLGQTVGRFAQEMRTVMGRSRSLMGSTPPELAEIVTTFAQESQVMRRRIEQANREGRPELARALTLQVNQRRQEFQQRINRVALRQAGGDQRAAGWISTFLSGGNLDAGQAADATLFYAERGSLPAGMRSSTQARAAFNAARQAITQVDNEIRGRPNVSRQERQNLIRQRIAEIVPNAYTANTFNEFVSALPELAQQENHEFAGIARRDFDMARRAGETVPFQEIGRELGISEADARLLFQGQYQGADSGDVTRRFEEMGGRGHVFARQQAVFAEYLDRSPSASPQFRPSRALADLLQRPGIVNRTRTMESLARETSFGDYLSSSMSEGRLTETFAGWSNNFTQQVDDIRVAEVGQSRYQSHWYRTNPIFRARVILAAIPGIEQAEEQALMEALEPNYRQQISTSDTIRRVVTGTHGRQGTQQLRSIILNQRFNDPGLERIRRIAAQHWDQAASTTDNAVEAYIGERE